MKVKGYKSLLTSLLTILLFPIIVFGQKQDSLLTHQIGINASDFLNRIFKSQKNSSDLVYNYFFTPKDNLRMGLNYSQITTDDGSLDIGFKIGYAKVLLDKNKWSYQFGIDLLLAYTYYKSGKREVIKIGVIPTLGISFKLSEHFYLVTEPNFYFIFNRFKDKGTFSNDNLDKWFENGLGNIGHLQLTFVF